MVFCYSNGAVRRAMILYEVNEKNSATEVLMQSMVSGLQEESLDEMVPAFLLLAKIRLAHGDLHGALYVLQEAEKKANDAQLTKWPVVIAATRTRLNIEADDCQSVEKWLSSAAPDPYGKITEGQEYEYITLARANFHTKKFYDAMLVLKRLSAFSEKIPRKIEILNLQALVLQAMLETDKAVTVIHEALTLGRRDGYVRSFLDEGEPMGALLQKYLRIGAKNDLPGYAFLLPYVRSLLRELRADCLNRTWGRSNASLSETHLTRREREILRLLEQNETNAAIAEKLTLTVNTVKVHNRNLFYKLNARNRTMAVEQARKLGLL